MSPSGAGCGLTIAIDGPVGSGKSTVGAMVAQQLGCCHVDSGAVYRAVAWLVEKKNLHLEDVNAIVSAAREATVVFKTEPKEAAVAREIANEIPGQTSAPLAQNGQRVLVDGEDATDEIRSLSVAQLTSKISVIAKVRDAVNIKLREMAKGGNIVMDGRDIGTVVLPDADLKVFLTAEIETRAKRRQKELATAGKKITLEELIRQIKERDDRDSSRAVAPLCAAKDAVVIDTDQLNIDEVVPRIIALVAMKKPISKSNNV
jgi:cytidylate kinase